jgi:predicted esterase
VPLAQSHKNPFIILHGRGSTASKIARPLLSHLVSDSHTLLEAFHHIKFIFPTAPKRRAKFYNRSVIYQWFDCWHLPGPEKHDDLQYDGLCETSTCLHGLLREEIELVGAGNVVLWGINMGCAAALVAVLTWEGEPFGGVVVMCGWLPLRRGLEGALKAEQIGEEDVFEADTDAIEELDPVVRTIAWLREELDMPKGQTTMTFQHIPIFLGHGVEDQKVPVDIGREAAVCLKALGVPGCWKEYERLVHWNSKDMLHDIK